MRIRKKRNALTLPPVSRLTYLITAQFALMSCFSFNAHAYDYFNPAMLETGNAGQGNTDLTIFEEAASQAPGNYRVDIYLNNELQDTRSVEFRSVKDANGTQRLQPCLSVAELHHMGVNTDLFPALGAANAACANISAIPAASSEFRFSNQQLLLSFPQAAVVQKARGYVPESQWDEGIPAMLLNYSLKGTNNFSRKNGQGNDSSQYMNLRPGINFGGWHLRNYTAYTRDSDGHSQWDTVYTYLQRNIRSLKSQLVMGDSSSPSDIFESVPFRGAQIASDDDMLPESRRGYAPIIRGIARTNAEVVIRQDGHVIYQSNVAPGAFEINDMYPTGGSGDLHVTVKEADGSEQHAVVPYASLPVLQREGRLKYSITGGQYRSYDSSVDKTFFAQATGIYGLPAGLTLYGGSQFSDHYRSLSFGIGKNLGAIGAISTDVIQAWSSLRNQPADSGQSWRIRYSKNIVETGTNFAIAGYRYSTDGYYSLQEVLDSYRGQSGRWYTTERRRNRTEVTMTQSLGDQAGSLSVSLISEDYWRTQRSMRSISVGYNNSWNSISYGLNYNFNRNTFSGGNLSNGGSKIHDKDHVFAFNVSVPLSIFSASSYSNTYVSYNANSSKKSGTSHNVGLNGTALEDNNLNWSVQEGYDKRGSGNSGNLYADYRGTYGEATASYAYDRNRQSLNYGLQGGIVAHQHGITFGQPLGETMALVAAKGAGGVSVLSQTGVKTDWRGYAIVPYASPYRRNPLQLNTERLAADVDLTDTSRSVVPTRGAIVQANFKANVGQRVLMTLLRPGNLPVPFGAMAKNMADSTAQSFIVGDQGQVYLSGMPDKGTLLVSWGKNGEQQCRVNYTLPPARAENGGISIVSANCN